MSTLILHRRLPPPEYRPWPEPPAGMRVVAPSSLFVQPRDSVISNAWPSSALAISVAVGLHAALAFCLWAGHPQAPEPTPPMPITVQWMPPPVTPPTAQPTPQPPEPAPQPEAQPPAPLPKAAPAETKPAETPRPKAQARSVPVKTRAKTVAQAPSTAPTTPAPMPVATPATAPAQTTTAPIGRAGYLNNPPPVYPPAAARRHQEGTTLLRVHVLPDGHADQVQVQQTSGVPALDEAAQAAVRQWTFIPAKRGATPVEGWVNVPLAFKLAP